MRVLSRSFVVVLVLLLLPLLLVQPAAEQTDPRKLPLWNEQITKVGTFGLPGDDRAGGMIAYGGRLGSFGVSADGKRLFISCSRKGANGPTRANAEGWAVLEIPALGQKARVLQDCAGLGSSDIATIHPDPTAWRPQWGAVVEQNGRLAVAGFIEYDASGATSASHWSGTSFTSMTGPWRMSDTTPRNREYRIKTGYVKSHNGRIPVEWQGLLGGDSFATAGYSSIVSRASHGSSFIVYNIADLTKNDAPAELLLGCPHEVASCVTYGTPTSPTRYNGSEHSGGAFIVPGTRTLVHVERESDGRTCYGYATRDQALDGKQHPGPDDAEWCWSLTDNLTDKGPKGYPYRLVAKLYDLNELVAVKQGRKHPWDIIVPYKVVAFPDTSPGIDLYGGSGAFNEVTGEYYLNLGHYGDNTQVRVYKFGSDPPAPAPAPRPR